MNEIVTVAEHLIPLIGELRHTTENDRCIAQPIVEAIRKKAAGASYGSGIDDVELENLSNVTGELAAIHAGKQ